MKQTIAIFASNDWTAGAKALADELRAWGNCSVRIRDGALFTADQAEAFDVVHVRGDFPAVMAAYPGALLIEDAPPEIKLLAAVGDSDAATDAKPKQKASR